MVKSFIIQAPVGRITTLKVGTVVMLRYLLVTKFDQKLLLSVKCRDEQMLQRQSNCSENLSHFHMNKGINN